ncbi:MAG: SPOR domain-containing protein [Magnetococcales bacterium]|nr:SPOR domain-containing protein [Magnetococcales bacterium]
MINPRYPTSAKYRRHRSKSYLLPAVLGLVFGGAVFLVVQKFSGDGKKTATVVEKRVLAGKTSEKPEILEDVMPVVMESEDNSRFVPIKLEPEFQPRLEPEPKSMKPLLKPSKKPEETVKSSAKFLPAEKDVFSKKDQAKNRKKPQVDVAMPSGLLPKIRDPDVEITFYRELSRRKVVVPKEDSGLSLTAATGLVQTSNLNVPRPLPPEKKIGLLSVYQVQLVIFSNLDRARAVVRELKKRRAPAYLVKVKGDKNIFYRVRLGPFSSQEEAKWAMDRWRIKGSSPLILRQRP